MRGHQTALPGGKNDIKNTTITVFHAKKKKSSQPKNEENRNMTSF